MRGHAGNLSEILPCMGDRVGETTRGKEHIRVPPIFGASQVTPITLVLAFLPVEEQTWFTSQVRVLIV